MVEVLIRPRCAIAMLLVEAPANISSISNIRFPIFLILVFQCGGQDSLWWKNFMQNSANGQGILGT